MSLWFGLSPISIADLPISLISSYVRFRTKVFEAIHWVKKITFEFIRLIRTLYRILKNIRITIEFEY